MAKRIITRIGDVFEVQLDNCKKYFQYIANDMTQLNSSVIRTFVEEYPLDYSPILENITAGKLIFMHIQSSDGVFSRICGIKLVGSVSKKTWTSFLEPTMKMVMSLYPNVGWCGKLTSQWSLLVNSEEKIGMQK